MKYRNYLIVRLAGIIAMIALGIWSGTSGNYIVLIPEAIVLFAILFTLRKRVTEIVVDERVTTVAFRASRLAFVIFILLAVIAGTILLYLADTAEDTLFHTGLTLEYAACALLVIYWAAFAYYNRKLGGSE